MNFNDPNYWIQWVDRLYDVRMEPDKLLIMITNKHYEVHRQVNICDGICDICLLGECPPDDSTEMDEGDEYGLERDE